MQKKLNSGVLQPVGGFLERVFHGPADLDALGDHLEFLADRARNFGGDDAERFGDRQARAQAAHQQFDRVGKLGGERVRCAA